MSFGQRHDCGVTPYCGGFKAWFTTSGQSDRQYVTANRGGVFKDIRFSTEGDAWRAAKDQMIRNWQAEIQSWKDRPIGNRGANPLAELARVFQDDQEMVIPRPGKLVPVDRKTKKKIVKGRS